MDNLTHSLAGAVLGQMGLKRKTGLGMATLIIAANIPDIDAVATLLGGQQHLAIRRGITHGPVAMLLLPLLLWQGMLWFDRWQTKRGTRPVARLPVNSTWLLILAVIGTLSHPALDWLNNYGIRLLEPFSSRWFYGDSIFIIDIWIWAMLIAGIWLSRRRERARAETWRTPAIAAFGAVCVYIFGNGLITGRAEASGAAQLTAANGKTPELVVASPPPVSFWSRDMFWRDRGTFGDGSFSLPEAVARIKIAGRPDGMTDPRLAAAIGKSADAKAFLFWSRMPYVEIDGNVAMLRDQRFGDARVADRFAVRLELE
jgi:inner membrane protein